jgi:hypothetical protein
MTGGAARLTDGAADIMTHGIMAITPGMAISAGMAITVMDIHLTDTITITAIMAGMAITTATGTAEAGTQADILPIVPVTLGKEWIITDLPEVTTTVHQEVL